MHLLIPFACSNTPACESALRPLQLPHLEKLLRRLVLVDTDAGDANSLSAPHERALARVYGMPAPDGCIAWAADEITRAGRDPGAAAWAWITPAHWDVGADHILMADPRALDLQETESRELLAAMQPFFAGDGIALEYAASGRWLARGPVFDKLPSASLDRVAGREIRAWMPSVPGLRRLQNEMQMLLYTHPVNDARSARGLATVNSFWVSGTGSLGAGMPTRPQDEPVLIEALRDAAIRNDWAAWAQSWAGVDNNECRHLLQSLDTGNNGRLTLCGERSALSFGPAPASVLARLRRRFTRTTLNDLYRQL